MTNSLVIVFALVAGLVVTFPARRQLEGLGWALVGLPVGFLGWSVVALTTTVLGMPYTPGTVALGWFLAMAIGFAFFGAAARHGRSERLPVAEWGVAALVASSLTASAAWFAHRSTSVFTYDSFNFYEPYGSLLARTGEVSSAMLSSRMVVVPSLHAAGRFFGGEWHFVTYPMAALLCSLLVVWGSWRLTRHGAAGRFTALGAGLVALTMASSPQFRIHAEYVHSHVITALYLLLGVLGIAVAYFAPQPSDEAASLAQRRVWLAVAGLAAAGVALARPDGLAYGFVAVALVVALQAVVDRPGGSLFFFAPLIVLPGAFVAIAVLRDGLWVSRSKLSASTALALLGLEGFAAGVSLGLDRLRPRFALWIVSAVLTFVSAAALIAVYLLRPRAPEAFENMVANLVLHGGWGPLWVYIAAALLVCVLCAPLRRYPWLTVVLLGFGLFFAAAFVVHGAAHPGRLGWGDSFNRVAFHGLPLAFLFGAGSVAAMLNEITGAWKSRASDRMDA